ncbi:hypothetical protein [Hyphomonas sp.]|uniref:hypothetical protein n=1 Tax=Hyphomonas sp. TaxID=87 RepID=UPI0030027801
MSFLVFLVFVLVIVSLARSGKSPPPEASPDADRIANLAERVRTLEAIILDRDRRLRREIDGLQ